MAAKKQNPHLANLLRQAGWTAGQLARAMNTMFYPETVAETAAYAWQAGSTPRQAVVARRAAAALSRQLGRTVTASQIWPSIADAQEAVEPASYGLDGPWTRAGTLDAVADWLGPAGSPRREFIAVTGTSLMLAVWEWLEPKRLPTIGPPPTRRGGNALVETIESMIPLLQRLDDAHGGGASLPFVEAQVRAVALELQDGRHPEPVVRRLLAAISTLGQLAGWICLDAGAGGAAQRHWFRALRAAREIGDRPLASHILADLAFQAASGDVNHARDGVVLGEAAAEIAARAPATVRASVDSRLAYAYAAAGRRREFESTAHRARSHLAARQDEREPAWMYFLTDGHLDCQAGYARIAMGRRQIRFGDGGGRHDVDQGIRLLRTGAFDVALNDPSQRRALFEGSWLALGHATLADAGEALALAEAATARIPTVKSPRSNLVLEAVVAQLKPRHNLPEVRDRLPAIEHALGRAR